MMIWRDVSELRSDVKALLSQSSIDKTEIQNLKKDVQILEGAVFSKPKPSAAIITPKESPYLTVLFKHEEIFDINKYLN